MAALTATIDPDDGGADYGSLNAAESGDQQDLTAGNTWTGTVTAASGTADTTATTWNGWTTDSSNFPTITGGEAVGTSWNTNNYRLSVANSVCLTIWDDYMVLEGFQIESSAINGAQQDCVAVGAQAASSTFKMDSMLLKGAGDSNQKQAGLTISDSDVIATVWNTIAFNIGANVSSDASPFRVNSSTSADFYNCTADGGYRGYYQVAGTVTVTNSIASNQAGSSFQGTITVDYCLSDDGTGTNAQTPSGADWANEYTTDGSDFSLLAGGNAVGNGTDDPGSGLYSDDINGTARTSTWDIGADEYVAAGGISIPVVMHHLRQQEMA